MLLLLLSILLLPGGYLAVHIEPRFLWPAAFLLLIAGTHLLTRIFTIWRFRPAAHRIAWFVLISSFLITPINSLQDLRYANQREHSIAAALQADGINGKFASGPTTYSAMRKIAFLSGNQYFENHRLAYTSRELLDGIGQSDIDFLHFIRKLPEKSSMPISTW
jgi:hypothetical protein